MNFLVYCQLDPFMVTDLKNAVDLKGCLLLSRLWFEHAGFVLSEKYFFFFFWLGLVSLAVEISEVNT